MKITEAFERGEFVVTAEVGPPKGYHIEHLLDEAKTYHGSECDRQSVFCYAPWISGHL